MLNSGQVSWVKCIENISRQIGDKASVQNLGHLTISVLGNRFKCTRSCCIVCVRNATSKDGKWSEQEHTWSQKEENRQNSEKDPKRIEYISAIKVSSTENAAWGKERYQANKYDYGENNVAANFGLIEVIMNLY